MNAQEAAVGTECPPCPHTHSPAEAAALLGIPEDTLRRKAGRQEYPSTKFGRHLRFSDENVAEIIRLNQRTVAQPRRRAH